MRTAFIISSSLHVGAVLLAYLGLPLLSHDDELVDLNIVVEMVTVDDVTRAVRAKPIEKAKPKPSKSVAKPKPVAAPKPPPPAPKQVAAIEPELAPEPLPPEPKPVVVPKPEPKPVLLEKVKEAPKPRWKPKPPPRPVVKKATPKPKPKPVKVVKPKKKKKKFNPTRIAALLDKAKKEDAPEVKKKKTFDQVKPPELNKPKVVSATAPVQEFGRPLTISEVDAVRAKIETCWSMPSGARDAGKLVVRIKFRLNPDGRIQGTPEIVNSGYLGGNDKYYRIAAEAARRAVQKCEPYDMLPRAKYKRWQDMEMTFDPKEMMGG